MSDYKPVPAVKETKETKEVKAVLKTPEALAAEVVELNKVPPGAIDINLVKPGYGPLEGSPKENDPSQLANPNNPLSPITKPANPSNPANPPAMQSDKPASEVRIYNDLLAKDSPVQVSEETKKRLDEIKKEKEALHKTISTRLAAFGNTESSIPPGDEYWNSVNRLRILNNP